MSCESTKVPLAMVVEDHAALRRSLELALTDWAHAVIGTDSVPQALAWLTDKRPQLVVTDVRLPDGSGLEVARAAAKCSPLPIVVAMSGEATAEEAFYLAQSGVRGYLTKPLQLDDLNAALQRAFDEPPDLDPFIRASVGKVNLTELEGTVRQTLIDEALARTAGKKKRAAELLAVSRQLLQHILRNRC